MEAPVITIKAACELSALSVSDRFVLVDDMEKAGPGEKIPEYRLDPQRRVLLVHHSLAGVHHSSRHAHLILPPNTLVVKIRC